MIKLETKIQNTDLPKTIRNIFSRCHIFTINELVNCDFYRLLRIRGIGKARLSKVNSYLNDNGFFLK